MTPGEARDVLALLDWLVGRPDRRDGGQAALRGLATEAARVVGDFWPELARSEAVRACDLVDLAQAVCEGVGRTAEIDELHRLVEDPYRRWEDRS